VNRSNSFQTIELNQGALQRAKDTVLIVANEKDRRDILRWIANHIIGSHNVEIRHVEQDRNPALVRGRVV